MAPGTVLYSVPAKDGPALLAVVQPDSSVAWTPAAPVPAPAPIAPPVPGESKAKPKTKTSTRTRRRPTP
jgi:hypothetical protein